MTQLQTGLQCTNSTVIFNCTREGTALLWRLRLQNNPSVPSTSVVFLSDASVNLSTTQTLAFNNQQHTAILLERSPLLNSSLTITAMAGMDLIVECVDDQAEVLMLKLNVSQVSGIFRSKGISVIYTSLQSCACVAMILDRLTFYLSACSYTRCELGLIGSRA